MVERVAEHVVERVLEHVPERVLERVEQNVAVTGADAHSHDTPPVTDFTPVADARRQDIVWPAMAWPPPPDTVLRGRAVEVTPVDLESDVEALFEALDDDRVWVHLPWRPRDPASYAEFLERRMAAGLFPWVVRLRISHAGLVPGTVVGTSSYLEVAVGDARLEIGFTAYRPDVWASAVNPDTKLLLLGYAFDELDAGRVQLKTDVRNTRSQRAIARLGARYEGTLGRYQRRADGTVRDTVLFSVLAEDWPGVRQGLLTRLAGLEG
ncbi:MAG TPA: GNAT family protein [Acidimicrobiales bacterium]|nr:GNAT family protein [Acidimicrobiales bacterium]